MASAAFAAENSGPSAIEPPAPAASAADAMAQDDLATAIDAARTKEAPDAPHLKIDPTLTEIARARAYAMANGAPFAHEDRQGRQPAIDMVRAKFGQYGYIGENIFQQTRNIFHFSRASGDFDPEAFSKVAAQGWMRSEEHRANILSPDYTESGIGVYTKGEQTYAAQIFWGPPPAPVRARAKPPGPVQHWLGQ